MLAEMTPLNEEDLPEQPNTRSSLSINNCDQLRSYWRYYAGKAHALNKNGKVEQAAKLFTQCISIANCLVHAHSHAHSRSHSHSDVEKVENTEQSGIELHYFASHNLAACQNQLQLGTRAEHTLRYNYQTIISLCSTPNIQYENKLDALSILDKSLFSLTSQLAYLGKVNEIHELITKTDRFAQATLEHTIKN